MRYAVWGGTIAFDSRGTLGYGALEGDGYNPRQFPLLAVKSAASTTSNSTQQWYGPVHVIFGHNNLNGELWVVVSDEPTTLQTFREYALRFDIETCQLQCPIDSDRTGTNQLTSSKALKQELQRF